MTFLRQEQSWNIFTVYFMARMP